MTLDEQLHALADKHNLTSLSITLYTMGDGTRFIGASAQGDGFCGSDGLGMSGTAQACVASAIADLNGKRVPSIHVPELATVELAA